MQLISHAGPCFILIADSGYIGYASANKRIVNAYYSSSTIPHANSDACLLQFHEGFQTKRNIQIVKQRNRHTDRYVCTENNSHRHVLFNIPLTSVSQAMEIYTKSTNLN